MSYCLKKILKNWAKSVNNELQQIMKNLANLEFNELNIGIQNQIKTVIMSKASYYNINIRQWIKSVFNEPKLIT